MAIQSIAKKKKEGLYMYVKCGEGTYLNARETASTQAVIVYYIPHGEEVSVIDNDPTKTWSKVKPKNYKRNSAWVKASYLQSSKPTCSHNTQGNALGNRNMAYNSFGRYVYNLQIGLGISADGDYGSATKTAVEDFQESKGLTADGIAGSKTLSALWGDSEAQKRIKDNGI